MVQSDVVRRTRLSIMRMEERTRRSLARLEQRLQLKRKAVVRALAGLCLPLLALVIALLDPIPKFGRMYMKMAEGYPGYTLWERPPVGAYARVYLFNVTNAEQFLSGEHRNLKLEEVGPFTYLENRTNTNMTLDWKKNVLRFIPRTRITFLPEMSIGDPKDFNFTIPNLSLLATSSMLSEYPYWTTVAFNLLLSNLGTEPFLRISAHDYLWGYEDPLVQAAHTVLPGWVTAPKLGILAKLYEDPEKEFMEIELEAADRYRIRNLGGHEALPAWADSRKSGSSCNHFYGSYEGINYSPNFNEDTTYHLYRPQACRTIPMVVRGRNVTSLGIEVLEFNPRADAFDPNQENDCLCKKGRCLPRGMSDLSPCYMGMPFTISKPHCLGCEAVAVERIEGLAPDAQRHETVVWIEPEMGIPMITKSSSQSNIVVRDVKYITVAKPFSNIIYPMFWINMEFQPIPPSLQAVLRWRFVLGPALLTATQALLLATGLLLLAYNVYRYLRPPVDMEYRILPAAEKEMGVFVHNNPLMDDVEL